MNNAFVSCHRGGGHFCEKTLSNYIKDVVSTTRMIVDRLNTITGVCNLKLCRGSVTDKSTINTSTKNN